MGIVPKNSSIKRNIKLTRNQSSPLDIPVDTREIQDSERSDSRIKIQLYQWLREKNIAILMTQHASPSDFDFSTRSPPGGREGREGSKAFANARRRRERGRHGMRGEGRIHRGTHWPRRAYPTRPFFGAKMAIEVTALAAVASPSYTTTSSSSTSSSSSFPITVFSLPAKLTSTRLYAPYDR